jgi:glutathione S-transferase
MFVAYLRRQRDRIDLCLDWLDKTATREGFAPGVFSIMDLNLVCALGNVDNHKSFEWRGRPTLEAIVVGYAERPRHFCRPVSSRDFSISKF